MTDAEAQRAVADAILLERAHRVLQRRYGGGVCPDWVSETVTNLHNVATALRRQAELPQLEELRARP